MNYLLVAAALLAAASAQAQTNLNATSQAILREGQTLYQLERASWVATDLLQASHFPVGQVSSYFSYTLGDSVRTLFIGGPVAGPRVVAEYRFPQEHLRAASARRTGTRSLRPTELRLLQLRQHSMADLQHVPGVELPKNTAFNAVLLPKGDQTWVYVFTATTQPGVVLLGNDYLLQYNAAGQLLTAKKLHSGVIALGRGPAGQVVEASLHAHRPSMSPFMTPTDVCTLLLYRDQLAGTSHLVLGRKYVSIFSFRDAQLFILTRQAFAQQQSGLSSRHP